MAWFIRKAFKIGPLLRMNLSKSGVGFSFGVKGARIIHIPRGFSAAGRQSAVLILRGGCQAPDLDGLCIAQIFPVDEISTLLDSLLNPRTRRVPQFRNLSVLG